MSDPEQNGTPLPESEHPNPEDLEQLGEDGGELVELPPEVTREISKTIKRELTIVARSYIGPMPHPDHLAQYDQIVPGAAKDILEEFKANSRHSRDMDALALRATIRKDTRAQWMCLILLIFGFILIAYVTYTNHDEIAKVIAGTLLVAVIGGYLVNKFGAPKSDRPANEDPE